MVKDGKMGCYLQQCSLESNGTVTAFSGDVTAFTQPGAYVILQNCNETADWFRVVAKMEMCSRVNTVLAVYVYFDDATVTINHKHNVWVSVWMQTFTWKISSHVAVVRKQTSNMFLQVNGKAMTQNTFSKNGITVSVSDNTVNITRTTSVQLVFDSINELTLSVSDAVANTVCGACGKLKPMDTTLLSLRERVLGSFHGLPRNSAYLNPWIAPDFPSW